MTGKGNSKFALKQKFDLSEEVTVYQDSLKVFYNNKQVILKHNLNNEESAPLKLSGNELWEASFQFEQGVFEGDTIAVFGPAYIHCNDQHITLDTLKFSFSNRLRIYGVNDL